MGGNHDDFFFVCAAELADDIAGFIKLHAETGGGEHGLDGGGAGGLLKRRGGDFREANLFVVDGGEVTSKPFEGYADLRVLGKERSGVLAIQMRRGKRARRHG